jgi:hypothetical protein
MQAIEELNFAHNKYQTTSHDSSFSWHQTPLPSYENQSEVNSHLLPGWFLVLFSAVRTDKARYGWRNAMPEASVGPTRRL